MVPHLPHDGHHGRGRRADDVGRQYVLGAVGVTIFAGGIGSLILVVTILPVLYSKIYK